MDLLEGLARLGPSTATELSELLESESPANCSWHLRQLARFGFIEEEGTGPGRQRRWRIVPESTSVKAGGPDVPRDLDVAADAFDEILLERATANRARWKAMRRDEPARWREASFSSHSWFWLTSDELEQFSTEYGELIDGLIAKAMDRLDPSQRPPGSRAIQMMTWAVPVGMEHDTEEGMQP